MIRFISKYNAFSFLFLFTSILILNCSPSTLDDYFEIPHNPNNNYWSPLGFSLHKPAQIPSIYYSIYGIRYSLFLAVNKNMYGLDLPLPFGIGVTYGNHYGVGFGSIFYTKYNRVGLDISFFNIVNYGNLIGLQFSIVGNGSAQGGLYGIQGCFGVNFASKEIIGCQFACIANYSSHNIIGFQISGLTNIALKESIGFLLAGLFNFSKEMYGFSISTCNIFDTMQGLQLGLLNVMYGDSYGMQLGLINATYEDLWGIQIGLVNYAKKLYGVQIGLINVNYKGENGIVFFPIVNIGF